VSQVPLPHIVHPKGPVRQSLFTVLTPVGLRETCSRHVRTDDRARREEVDRRGPSSWVRLVLAIPLSQLHHLGL
jgi:hypothetical protein